jgi:putative ABC transport system ATP-binding protein
MISITDICYTYNSGKKAVKAVDGVTFDVEKGDFIAITGASGSGKSTLAHIIGCLLRPSSGRYLLNGIDTAAYNKNQLAEIRNKLFGFVFQKFNLLPKVTTIQNVMLPHKYCGLSKKESKKIAISLLERLGLQNRVHHKPNELSGGEQQRVAIARALVNSPKILLADEPTGNLDSKNCKIVMDIFKKLVADGLTVIYVTHDQDLISHAAQVFRMKDGEIISRQSFKTVGGSEKA